MFNPGDAAKLVFDNLWILSLVLWVMVALGIGGSIYAFIKWVGRGVKTAFSPYGLFVIVIITIITFIAASYVTSFINAIG